MTYFLFLLLTLYPDHRHQRERMPITKMNTYVAMLPMNILPLCTSRATFQSDIGRWVKAEGWGTTDVPS